MDHTLLLKALLAYDNGFKFATATVIETTLKGTPRKPGSKMLVLEDGSLFGSIGGGRDEKEAQKQCLKSIKSGKSTIMVFEHYGKGSQPICGGETRVFVEPFKGIRNMLILGGGHIGLALSIIAKMMDFKVTVIDNRKGIANKQRFSHVDFVKCGSFSPVLKKIKTNKQTYIVIATFGHKFDYICLKNVLKKENCYIGLISSKTKREEFKKRLAKEGFTKSDIESISAPAGLDIGAQTPQEIAVSIMAEIIKTDNKEFLGTGKFKTKSGVSHQGTKK